MKKRVFSIILCLCMIFSLLPAVASAVSTGDFSDFPQASHWAYSALEAAVKNGLMTGDSGHLNPTANMSRAEMATVINRAFGATAKADISAFTDVPKGKWYYEDIAKAVAMGTFEGDGGGTMRPEDPITRQEAFVVLARALSLSGSSSGLNKFTDRGSVASWAAEALGAMAAEGYIQGDGGLLSPLAKISRQEFAQVMFNLFKSYVGASVSVSSLPSGNVIINGSGAALKNLTVYGDLIIADGVGSGGVTLDGVTVTGRIVVRGGGSSALKLIGSTVKGKIVVTAQGAGISADDSSALGQIVVAANNVTVTAKSGTVTVGAGVTGAKVNGKDLAGGQSTEIGSSSGGGTPPVATVPTSSLIIKGTTMTVGKGQEALAVTRNSGANDALKWESSAPTVVRVDASSGKLSAVGTGSATISAESASGVVGSTTVYVVNPSNADDEDKNTFGLQYTITEPGTVMENCSFTTLTIAESVGTGEVTLKNVTATTFIVKGGGKNTVSVDGGSYGTVNVNGTPVGGTRILASGSAVVAQITVASTAGGGVTVEQATGSNASIGEITANAATTVKGANVSTITASANLTVTNATVSDIKTQGSAAPTVTLTDSTVDKVETGADSTTITGNSGVTLITASGDVTTGAGTTVGTISVANGADITANAAVGSVTGTTTGSISLANSGTTAVTASAGSVRVSGESKPTVSGTVPTVTVAANSEGTSGVTVTGTTTNITATGNGSVGEISIGGNATPTVNTGTATAVVSVSDTAGATVTGNATVLNTSTGTVTNNTTTIEKVTPTLQYIAVTSLPTKTEYKTNETLNTAGLVVTGYYTVPGFDGTISKPVTGSAAAIDTTTTGTKTVTVSYTEDSVMKTTSFNVNVVAKTVASISIKSAPTTKTYDLKNGDSPTLNTADGKITVNYTSSLYPAETKNIESGWCSITSGTNLTTVGAKTVTVSYTESSVTKTTSFTVNVIDSAADALALAKSNAKAEFLNYVADKLIAAVYSETGKASMKSAKDAGITAIDGATTTQTVADALAAKKLLVNAILTQDGEWTAEAESFIDSHYSILNKTTENIAITDKADVSAALSAYNGLASGVQSKLTAQKSLLDSLLAKIATLEAAQTLTDARTSAKANLTSALTGYTSGHYETNIQAITDAKTAGETAITNATTVATVTAALDSALAAMASFKSDAQLLADAKTTAINELNSYIPSGKTLAEYNATGKAQIADARTAGVSAINAAEATDGVGTALSAAKGNIDAVKTAAQMAAETLAAAKNAAKAELNAYGNVALYRDAQKATFNTAKTNGTTAINAATTTDGVTAALKAAKTAIDKIPTDAQLDIIETNAISSAVAKVEVTSIPTQTNTSSTSVESLTTLVTGLLTSAINNEKITVALTSTAYTAAIDGTAASRNGTAGSFSFTATLTCGEHSTVTRLITVLINPVKFGSIAVNGVAYTDLQAALTAAGTEQSVEIVGDYTIASGTTVTVGANQTVVVKSGGSLTNSGTIKYHKSSQEGDMSDSGQLIIEQGGSYAVGTTKLVGGSDAVFNLLDQVMDTKNTSEVAIEQGEVWILGAPNDDPNETENYLNPFLFLNGNIEVPAGKSYTVSGSDYMVFAANGDLSVNGSLTSTAFNEVRGGITVESTGSLTLNNSAQTGGPAYSIGAESAPHSMGGSVFVKNGGSYTVGSTKLIGKTDAKLNMTSGDAMICGQPADGGENPFVFVFGDAKATAGAFDWQKYHLIVDSYTDESGTHTATLTIPSGVTVTLGSNEIRGSLVNDGTLVATNGLGVDGSVTNNGTIDNKMRIDLHPGATLNNTGTINGVKQLNDPNDESDDWWETAVVLNYGTPSASLTNNGTINDSVTVCSYVGAAQSDDKTPTVTGTITERYDVAVVETTAGLKRAIADTDFEEYHPIGAFKLTESVEIPAGHLLFATNVWYSGESNVDGSFTINTGVTLTNNGGAEFWGSTTVYGTIVNNQGENTHLIIGSNGDTGKTFTLNGALTNNGYMELDGQNGKGAFTIASSGTLTNTDHMNIHGYLLTNSGSFVNNGSIDAEFGYKADGTMEVGITGTVTNTGSGTVNGRAYVCNGAGLSAAASGTGIKEIWVVTGDEYDANPDVAANRTLTLTNDVTIQQGVTLTVGVTVKYDANGDSTNTYPMILSVPSGKTLTVNGELIVKGKLTIQEGGTVNGSGKLIKYDSAEITNNGTLSLASPAVFVTTEAALKAALSDTTAESITIDKSITLTDNLDLTKPVTIAEGWDGDLPRVILTVPEGKSLTISANMDVKGGLVGENGSITIADGKTVTVTGRMGYISSDATNAKLTVNGTLEFRNGAGLVLGNHYEGNNATAAGSVVNSGAIEVINGWIDFVNSNEQTVVSGTAINFYANRADLARELVNRLAGYPNMVEPEEGDYNSYGNAYSDWGDMYNDAQNPDNDAAHGLAWLLKNSIITESGRYIRPYGELPAADAKAIFTALATKILGEGHPNTAMTSFLGDLSDTGYISRNNIHVEDGNYDTNALNQLIDRFIAALNLSSVSVTDEAQLTDALKKNYVTDIHITGVDNKMTIIGKKDSESDTNNSFYLGGVENGERRIYIDAGVTLTVGDGMTSTKLDVQQGVELMINGNLTLKANSGMNVFGGLKPDNWGNEGMNLVTQEEGSYINFFPDVMEFGKRLQETVGARLTAATVTDETINAANEWPSGDGRIAGFEFLVAYGGLTYKTEQDNYKHWTPYEKLEYATAISVLTNVYKAMVNGATALPDGVKLEGMNNNDLISDNDVNELLRLFAAELPQLNDTTETFTVSSTPQTYSNKNYTNAVTISCSGTPDQYGWGGEIHFENCNFEKGVTINYSDSARFAVDFSDSCTVTGGVTVAPGTVQNHDLWKNNMVEIWGAKGLAINATAPTQVSCGSCINEEHFTLNDVTVTGTVTGNAQNEDWFNAAIYYNCDGEHDENFDWSNGGNHSECKMADGTGTKAATTSPEFQLSTGADGSITATGTGITYNVRVEGTADISGLTVDGGNEITVSDNRCASSVNIGANTVQVYDNANHGYSFTATTGTAVIRNQSATKCSCVTLNGKNLGTPHVFGDSTSGYQIFVGIASKTDLTFKVEQLSNSIWTELTTPTVTEVGENGQANESPTKLHISKGTADGATWITAPNNVRLTVTIGGGKVIYEPLADHTSVTSQS